LTSILLQTTTITTQKLQKVNDNNRSLTTTKITRSTLSPNSPNAHHKSFWQIFVHYRYAYRKYALGNIWKTSRYFIISGDLANINLNYMCLASSHDSYHLFYNPSLNDKQMIPVHKLWPLYVTLTMVQWPGFSAQ
jgi:hypothetical protein